MNINKWRKILFTIIFLILLIGIFAFLIAYFRSNSSVKDSSANTGSEFVGYSGTHFTLNSSPFYVGGTNNHYIPWAAKNEVDNVLDDAAAMHFNVVRTFVSSVRGSIDGTKKTIWYWSTYGDPNNLGVEGTYFQYWDTVNNKMGINDGPDGLQHIDYLLYKAKSLNIKILLAFNDFHFYTGGMQQMAEWYGIRNVTDPHKDEYTTVFTDPRVVADYKTWISHLLNRVNTYTGVMYKDDPTIFGWDLANEPAASSVSILQTWISTMASYVKSIDHNHLVTSGDEGYLNLSGDSPVGELANSNIDFGTMHTYPAFTKLTLQQTNDLIQLHCGFAKNAQKPVILEEFGLSNSNTTNQYDGYKLWLDNMVKNSDCGGFMFWRLTSHENGIVGYPRQNSEGFDIHNDNSQVSNLLTLEATAIQANNGNISSSSTTSPSSSSITSSSSSSSSSSVSSSSTSSSSSSISSSNSSSSISSSSSSNNSSSSVSSSSISSSSSSSTSLSSSSSSSSSLLSSSSISYSSSSLSSSSSSDTSSNSSSSTIQNGVACGLLDVNNDRKINIIDFISFASFYGKTCIDNLIPSNYVCGIKDNSRSGKINILDFVYFAGKYGQSC